MLQSLSILAPSYSVVPTTTSAATTTFGSGLFMDGGIVEYNDSVRFNVTAQGLLSIMAYAPTAYGYTPYADQGYRIVKNAASLDPYAVIAAICGLVQYGTADEALSVAVLTTAARTRKLQMRCGPTIAWARSLLGSLGITTREVHFVTATTPDGLDDGHTALEAQIGGQWRFFDIAGDGYFTIAGSHAALKDVAGFVGCTRVKLADTEAASSATAPLRSLWDQRLSSESLYLNWCSRIYQVPGILDTDGLVYFYMPAGTESRQSWLLSLSSGYRVLSKADWLARFYP